jgi:hypothetical protein
MFTWLFLVLRILKNQTLKKEALNLPTTGEQLAG